MCPRPFSLLVPAILTLLMLTAGALIGCGHNVAVSQTPQPSASPASGDQDHVNWSSFTLYEHAGLHSSSLEELSQEAGFPFVLPSYLPSTINHTMYLSSQLEQSPKDQAWVLVNPGSSPGIQMTEHYRYSDSPRVTGYSDDFDVRTIAGILVGCVPEPPNQTWPTPVPGKNYEAHLSC